MHRHAAHDERNRSHKRLPTSLTDEQWMVVEPLVPRPAAGGRPLTLSFRSVLDGVLYVLRAGCAWRLLPGDFSPWRTVHRRLSQWRDAGVFERLNHALVMNDRERAGRDASPTGVVVDAQSVRAAATGGTRGYDAGKKTLGIKRHVLVDTDGRLLVARLSPADLHDSHGGCALLRASRPLWSFLSRCLADRAYAGDRVGHCSQVAVTVVTGPANQRGFIVQKRRWVVERTFAWLGLNRRLARDYERRHDTALAWVYLAAAMILVRRMVRPL